VLGVLLVIFGQLRRPKEDSNAETTGLMFLSCLIVIYVALAGAVAAKAGMAHPRYYLFIVPAFTVAMGMVFAKVKNKYATVCAVAAVSVLSMPTMRSPALYSYEEFKAMTEMAVVGTDKDTVFLYPWAPNRDLYRVYLESLRGIDSRANMIGISFPDEVPQVCEKLKKVKQVAVIAHETGRARINEVYAACGSNWPLRESKNFHITFSEHWRASPSVDNHPPAP
jgi:hypothetical protein